MLSGGMYENLRQSGRCPGPRTNQFDVNDELERI
jgi:hypothetical protein